MTHQMPLLHSGTQRNHKDFSSDVPSNAVLVWHQMQNIFWKIMVVVVFGPSLLKVHAKNGVNNEFFPRTFHLAGGEIVPEKSALWTDAGVSQEILERFRSHWFIGMSREIRGDQSLGALFSRQTDQWPQKFARSLPRDWYWSMDGSSQCPCPRFRSAGRKTTRTTNETIMHHEKYEIRILKANPCQNTINSSVSRKP